MVYCNQYKYSFAKDEKKQNHAGILFFFRSLPPVI